MGESQIEVVTVGEALGLLVASQAKRLDLADEFIRSVAGAESNVAIGLARLGIEVAYVGRIGNDAPGRWIERQFRAERVDISSLRTDVSHPTGLLLRDAPRGIPATVLYHRAGSAGSGLRESDIPADLVAMSKAMFVSGITAMLSRSATEAVHLAITTTRAAGGHVFFDPNIRLRLAPAESWQSTMPNLLHMADTVLIGDKELQALFGHHDGRRLLRGHTSTVVVKSGAQGAEVHTAFGSWSTDAPNVDAVDAVGAGDAFAVGWIAGWLANSSIEDCLRSGVIVAALAVQALTDIEGYPDRRTLDLLLSGESDVDR